MSKHDMRVTLKCVGGSPDNGAHWQAWFRGKILCEYLPTGNWTWKRPGRAGIDHATSHNILDIQDQLERQGLEWQEARND